MRRDEELAATAITIAKHAEAHRVTRGDSPPRSALPEHCTPSIRSAGTPRGIAALCGDDPTRRLHFPGNIQPAKRFSPAVRASRSGRRQRDGAVFGKVTTLAGGFVRSRGRSKKSRAAGGLVEVLEGDAFQERLQDLLVGMGGQAGGMVNEGGPLPEVCKKSFQAMVADMQGAVKPTFFETYSIPQLRAFTPYQMEHSGRLVQPVRLEKGSQHYRPIGMGRRHGADRRPSPPKRHQAESVLVISQRPLEQRGRLPPAALRAASTAPNHVNNCSPTTAIRPAASGLASVVGTGAGTVKLDDMENSDFVMLIGGNPASNHPRMMRTLMMVRRGGGKVCGQSDRRDGPGEFLGAQRRLGVASSAPRSRAPTCSRYVGGDLAIGRTGS